MNPISSISSASQAKARKDEEKQLEPSIQAPLSIVTAPIFCRFSLDATNISAQMNGNELLSRRVDYICSSCPGMLKPVATIIAMYLQEAPFAYNPKELTSLQNHYIPSDEDRGKRNVARHCRSLDLPNPDRHATATASKLAILQSEARTYTIWDVAQKQNEIRLLPDFASGCCELFTFLNENTLLYVDYKYFAFIHQINENIDNAVLTPSTRAVQMGLQDLNEEDCPPLMRVYLDPQRQRLYIGFNYNNSTMWESYSTLFCRGETRTYFHKRASIDCPQLTFRVLSSSLSCNWNNTLSILYSSEFSSSGPACVVIYNIEKNRRDYDRYDGEDELTLISSFNLNTFCDHFVFSYNRLKLSNKGPVFDFGGPFVDHSHLREFLESCDKDSLVSIVDELSRDSSSVNVDARNWAGESYLHTIVRKPYGTYFSPDYQEKEFLELQIYLYAAFVKAGAQTDAVNSWDETVFDVASPSMRKWLQSTK